MINLLASTEKAIPKDNIAFLGNMPGDDLFPCLGSNYYTGYACTEWKDFEKKILDQYYAWNEKP